MNKTHKFCAPLNISEVAIKDPFWGKYIDQLCDVSVPFMWDVLNDNVPDAAPSHAIENFRIAAGMAEGEFYGTVFQDSDVAKWLEGAALSLARRENKTLEKQVDEVVDIIAAAQREDGYLDTYFIIKEPEMRWKNLQEGHELYCAGHMIEAAVTLFKATGKRKLLDVVCRMADLICDVFGTQEGKIPGYAGHPEIELALMKLYEITGCERYLNTVSYFLEQRGQDPYYFDIEAEARNHKIIFYDLPKYGRAYAQAHKPIREQDEAMGHAVRALYLYSGMADMAMHAGDENMMAALKRIWRNIVDKKMYITGAIGSTEYGEAFSGNYDLPNDRAYAETCASIGIMMLTERLLKHELDGEYADMMELALYNVVLASMTLEGNSFFYVNPLEVYPELEGRRDLHHVLPERPKWFSCACCPPNAIRTVLSIGSYAFSKSEDVLNIHLYLGGEISTDLAGAKLKLTSSSSYLTDGKVSYRVSLDQSARFTLNLRIPAWSKATRVCVNGSEVSLDGVEKGYLPICRTFCDGDEITLEVDAGVHIYRSNPAVRENAGKIAVKRGPLIYCAESVDNGENLHLLRLDPKASIDVSHEPDLLKGVTVIRMKGERVKPETGGRLYAADSAVEFEPADVMLIPYYAWANRGRNEMRVWIEEKYR